MESLENIRRYYGTTLKTNRDLKTSACCAQDGLPAYAKEILKDIHPEVTKKFYGCGSPIPPELEGMTVLDLGSGSGRDCFLASRLVGPGGAVIGVDMTPEQLRIAREHISYHMRKFGYDKDNVRFMEGYIEDLEGIAVATDSIDVVISNCVINLSPDKERVFREILRVLKPGGELYFSDVFVDRRLPEHLRKDPVLLGECLGGAMYTEDFRRLLVSLGCNDFRVVQTSGIELDDPYVEKMAGMANFYSMSIRLFKLDLEDRCENFGQVARYKGTIDETPHGFTLDDHHYFPAGLPAPVCGNTAAMLAKTRYGKHFDVTGGTKTHFGLFDCAPMQKAPDPDGGCC